MYPDANPYNLKVFNQMFITCSICNQPFYLEPGFYYGAMYMSYILTVLFSAVNVLLIGFIFGWNMWALIVGNAVLLLIGFPLFFRYSRILWLHLNVRFNRSLCEQLSSE
jgi:Protein of unknown function (DUF983)